MRGDEVAALVGSQKGNNIGGGHLKQRRELRPLFFIVFFIFAAFVITIRRIMCILPIFIVADTVARTLRVNCRSC